ncbi:flagellar biosynthesis protein FlhF [Amnibacterium setariae]|uniref:Uncharacterized protein n=1 Tax=Amnibacterium setariae TaxID=2306585 RepID=A0A3A1U3X4_9MICO|nr:hypothetical protein [Amnibacterium setariae]RIX28537.1 hypothetical protein D1781_14050 [Amnibacterium setariae]
MHERSSSGLEDRRDRLARVYGRNPDPAVIAALTAEAAQEDRSIAPDPEPAVAIPSRPRRRGRLLVPLLVGGLALAALGVGIVAARSGPAPTTAAPSPSAEPRAVEARLTVPGDPAGCHLEFFVALAHPTPAGLAQLARLEAFVRTHDWTADVPSAGGEPSSLEQARRAEQVLSGGLDEFGASRAGSRWEQRITRTSTTAFCSAPRSAGG